MTLPKGLEKISVAAFSQCESLKNISIPDSVKVIEYYAFLRCKSLCSIKLPAELEEIGFEAFSWCGEQENDIVIPSSVKIIGSNILGGTNMSHKIIFEDTSGWQKRLVDNVYQNSRSEWENIDSSVLEDGTEAKNLIKYNSSIYWENNTKLINYYEFQKV